MKKLCSIVLVCLVTCTSLFAQESKVALLFLTMGDLNYPELWKKALVGNEEKFSIYVHSKNDMQDPYFRQFRIAANVPTSWSIHMKAWQELLKEALQDESNEKFIFLSESCMPLYPLSYIYDELKKTEKTYMSYGDPTWLPANRTLVEFPESQRFMNWEWIILNRRHAGYIVADTEVIDIVSRHELDIEAYPSVLLNLKGELNDEHVINQLTTYTNWNYRNVRDGSPYHFMHPNAFTMALFEEAKKSGCFFARKFISTFPESLLEPLIEGELLHRE